MRRASETGKRVARMKTRIDLVKVGKKERGMGRAVTNGDLGFIPDTRFGR